MQIVVPRDADASVHLHAVLDEVGAVVGDEGLRDAD
jgi:hypothetical protein